jgi:hypothetical protein
MVDLNKLPPAALDAAMRGGTESWGQRGSVTDHVLYMEQADPKAKRWRMCRCGCRKRARYLAMANGVALASGCELKIRRWIKKYSSTALERGEV